MTVKIKPTNIDKIWAEDEVDIEAPSSDKISLGWEAEEIPPNEYFNWIDNRQDKFIAHLNQHGIPLWDQYTPYKDNRSVVQDDDWCIYRAVQDSQNVKPSLDGGTYWKKILDFSGAVNISDLSMYVAGLLQSEDGDELLDNIGATPLGKQLVFIGDAAAARTVLGTDLYLSRSVHTGTQAQNTVVDLESDLAARELLVNKATDFVTLNDTKYPTTAAVANYVASLVAGETYQGQWNANTNTPALVSSTGTEGDVWQVSVAGTTTLDGISSWDVGDEVVFTGGVWTKRSPVIPVLDTDDVTEAGNLYFTTSRVLGTTLTGLSTASNSAISASDTILQAIGKLQAQIDAMAPRLVPSGGSTGQVLAKTTGANYAVSWQNSSNSLTFPVNDIGSGTKTLDCASYNYWNVTGNGTCTITNLPSGNVVFTGYVRFSGGTSLSFTAAGKSVAWVGGVTPVLISSKANIIMFTNVLGSSTVNLMLVDQGNL